MANVVDYLIDTESTVTTVNNFDNRKQNEQKYFELCESCFWCASCIMSEGNKRHMTTTICPYCNEVRVESLPLTEKP